jgi:hypothetical protein
MCVWLAYCQAGQQHEDGGHRPNEGEFFTEWFSEISFLFRRAPPCQQEEILPFMRHERRWAEGISP